MGHSMSGGPPFGLGESDLDRASKSEEFIDFGDRPNFFPFYCYFISLKKLFPLTLFLIRNKF